MSGGSSSPTTSPRSPSRSERRGMCPTRPDRSTSTRWRSSSAARPGEGEAVRRYAVQRSLTVIPVLLGVSVLVFSFIHFIPGDPALTMLGERATPEKVAEVRARLGLDRPIWQQYVLYVGHALQGDLGVSIVRGDPVAGDLLRRFPATVELAIADIVVAIAFGIPIGVASAVWRNSVLDSLARLGALTG